MSLSLVATPIGHPKDITLRAIEVLNQCDVIVGEERRVLMPFLKSLRLESREVCWLNEHSKSSDVEILVDMCRTKNICLVSDCGTPGFYDPGAELVRRCRAEGISVTAIPGASSLMTLLSLTGTPTREFLFIGFLPVEAQERTLALARLKDESRAMVLMDTPYRLIRLLEELVQLLPNRKAVLGCDLTKDNEMVLEGTLTQILNQIMKSQTKDSQSQSQERKFKAEFVLYLCHRNSNH